MVNVDLYKSKHGEVVAELRGLRGYVTKFGILETFNISSMSKCQNVTWDVFCPLWRKCVDLLEGLGYIVESLRVHKPTSIKLSLNKHRTIFDYVVNLRESRVLGHIRCSNVVLPGGVMTFRASKHAGVIDISSGSIVECLLEDIDIDDISSGMYTILVIEAASSYTDNPVIVHTEIVSDAEKDAAYDRVRNEYDSSEYIIRVISPNGKTVRQSDINDGEKIGESVYGGLAGNSTHELGSYEPEEPSLATHRSLTNNSRSSRARKGRLRRTLYIRKQKRRHR